jgi:hypothetical protein
MGVCVCVCVWRFEWDSPIRTSHAGQRNFLYILLSAGVERKSTARSIVDCMQTTSTVAPVVGCCDPVAWFIVEIILARRRAVTIAARRLTASTCSSPANGRSMDLENCMLHITVCFWSTRYARQPCSIAAVPRSCTIRLLSRDSYLRCFLFCVTLLNLRSVECFFSNKCKCNVNKRRVKIENC